MRRACVSMVRKHRSEAQPAARRPERSEGHAQKINLKLCLTTTPCN
ncbi:MAG: hypothetical protein NZ455_03205 [Bacteroidia bacterium]|nr:hypothetical protein [Bacteroidia bacterium]MDW8345861.1 hypothetical protein [Bacteroidia bacterium]